MDKSVFRAGGVGRAWVFLAVNEPKSKLSWVNRPRFLEGVDFGVALGFGGTVLFGVVFFVLVRFLGSSVGFSLDFLGVFICCPWLQSVNKHGIIVPYFCYFSNPLTMSTTFISHLNALKNDRFALQSLTELEFCGFYAELLVNFSKLPDGKTWYLIGTDGCHLCEQSINMLKRLNMQSNNINIEILDIIDGSDEVVEALGVSIPVLLTPKSVLCYPFGVMDVMALV